MCGCTQSRVRKIVTERLLRPNLCKWNFWKPGPSKLNSLVVNDVNFGGITSIVIKYDTLPLCTLCDAPLSHYEHASLRVHTVKVGVTKRPYARPQNPRTEIVTLHSNVKLDKACYRLQLPSIVPLHFCDRSVGIEIDGQPDPTRPEYQTSPIRLAGLLRTGCAAMASATVGGPTHTNKAEHQTSSNLTPLRRKLQNAQSVSKRDLRRW